jgi:hypothetical protein
LRSTADVLRERDERRTVTNAAAGCAADGLDVVTADSSSDADDVYGPAARVYIDLTDSPPGVGSPARRTY